MGRHRTKQLRFTSGVLFNRRRGSSWFIGKTVAMIGSLGLGGVSYGPTPAHRSASTENWQRALRTQDAVPRWHDARPPSMSPRMAPESVPRLRLAGWCRGVQAPASSINAWARFEDDLPIRELRVTVHFRRSDVCRPRTGTDIRSATPTTASRRAPSSHRDNSTLPDLRTALGSQMGLVGYTGTIPGYYGVSRDIMGYSRPGSPVLHS